MTQSEATDSLYELYENCDPGLLKRTRDAKGMDEGVLARMACLSTAQVRQLESGGGSLFYSITIKRQAYKRLMMILGADPPTHVPVSADDVAKAESPMSPVDNKDTIDNIVALSSKSDYLERRPVKDFFLDLRYRIMAHRQFLGALLFLLAAVALLMVTWRGASSPSATDKAVQDTPSAPAVVPAVTGPAQTNTTPAPAMPTVAVATPPVSNASSELNSASQTQNNPAAASTTAASTVAPSPVLAPTPVVPAQASASAVVSKNTSPSTGCAHADGKGVDVVSTSANKPPNYVYVVSPVATTVCVVDGSKKATLLELRANEGRSVYGAPPWQVSGHALKDTQVFFQGVRVKVPEGQAHMTLLEKPAGQ